MPRGFFGLSRWRALSAPLPILMALWLMALWVALIGDLMGADAVAQTKRPPPPAQPVPAKSNCVTSGTFDGWLADFRKEAQRAGIKSATIATLDDITLDPSVIARDRRQSFFSQTFLEFQGKLATKNRIDNGRRAITRHSAIFTRTEREFGVPPEVIAAFWALESDFGSTAGLGKLSVLRSVATLAYDCRRGAYFRGQLLDALRIIERGDLTPAEMVGSWAGELGQTQFLPTYYYQYAVDYDGDGKRQLYTSIPDVIATSANFVQALGWQRGQPWLEEVRLTRDLPWEQAGLEIKHPRSAWTGWGVTKANGAPLAKDAMPASLVLLMGRNGPAFLAYPNFEVYTRWNQSLNYATTAAYLATRIAGADPISAGRGPVEPFGYQEMRELQQLLTRAGYYKGEIDGRHGAGSRAAVKAAQIKYGLPADSYPSAALVAKLREPR